MKKIWRLLICIAIPLAAGGLSALLTSGSMKTYQTLLRPRLSPPGWIFPVVWTMLYILMGISCYIIRESGDVRSKAALRLYGLQLFMNFLWTILFFTAKLYLLSFLWLAALWLVLLYMILSFLRIAPAAGWLQIPYLLWVTFAGYLNFGIWILNR